MLRGEEPIVSWWLLVWLELIVMAIIAIVDYLMGEAAQTLNGYEILRRTFMEPVGLSLPKVTDKYILLQERVQPFPLVWAWLLYMIWALVFAFPAFLLVKRLWTGSGG